MDVEPAREPELDRGLARRRHVADAEAPGVLLDAASRRTSAAASGRRSGPWRPPRGPSPRTTTPAGSSRLMTASLGHATAADGLRRVRGRLRRARRTAGSWPPRYALERAVEVEVLVAEVGEHRRVVRDPGTRSSSRACDVVSSTAASLPAATIARSVAWSSGAPGVVTWASWRSRASPTFVSTVPIRPGGQARRLERGHREERGRRLAVRPGDPDDAQRVARGRRTTRPAAWASAGRAAVDDELRQRRPGTRPARRSPRRRPPRPRGRRTRCRRRGSPGPRRTASPPRTSRESSATPRTAHVPHPADADRQVVAPCAAQEAGGVEPGEQPGQRSRLGGLGRGDGRRDGRVADLRPVAHRAVRPGVTRRSTRESPRPSA